MSLWHWIVLSLFSFSCIAINIATLRKYEVLLKQRNELAETLSVLINTIFIGPQEPEIEKIKKDTLEWLNEMFKRIPISNKEKIK